MKIYLELVLEIGDNTVNIHNIEICLKSEPKMITPWWNVRSEMLLACNDAQYEIHVW